MRTVAVAAFSVFVWGGAALAQTAAPGVAAVKKAIAARIQRDAWQWSESSELDLWCALADLNAGRIRSGLKRQELPPWIRPVPGSLAKPRGPRPQRPRDAAHRQPALTGAAEDSTAA